jgi:hypothetical protein
LVVVVSADVVAVIEVVVAIKFVTVGAVVAVVVHGQVHDEVVVVVDLISAGNSVVADDKVNAETASVVIVHIGESVVDKELLGKVPFAVAGVGTVLDHKVAAVKFPVEERNRFLGSAEIVWAELGRKRFAGE